MVPLLKNRPKKIWAHASSTPMLSMVDTPVVSAVLLTSSGMPKEAEDRRIEIAVHRHWQAPQSFGGQFLICLMGQAILHRPWSSNINSSYYNTENKVLRQAIAYLFCKVL